MTSRPSALCAGVTIDAFGCVITLGLLIWPQMLVEGGTRPTRAMRVDGRRI